MNLSDLTSHSEYNHCEGQETCSNQFFLLAKKCCPSFLIFAAHERIDSIIAINDVSVSLSFWSVSSEHIQEKNPSMQIQDYQKDQTNDSHFHYSSKTVFAVLSKVIEAKMKHHALHLQQDDILKTCQSTF